MKKYFLSLTFILGIIVITTAGGKETIREKMERVASTGGKIAFVGTIQSDIVVVSPSTQMGSSPLGLQGTSASTVCSPPPGIKTDLPAEYFIINEMVLSGLVEGFEISKDVFDLVDISSISKKTVSVLGSSFEIEDWWSTQYDLLVFVKITAVYAPSSLVRATSFSVGVRFEIYEVEDDGKQINIGVPILNKTLGGANSGDIAHANCFSTIEEFTENIAAPNSLVDQITVAVKENLPEVIEKENAKYEKAMKKKK